MQYKKFSEVKSTLSPYERVTMVDRYTGDYENYLSVEDVPSEYDEQIVTGIGTTKSEFYKRDDGSYSLSGDISELVLLDCLELVVARSQEMVEEEVPDISTVGYPMYSAKDNAWGFISEDCFQYGELQHVLERMCPNNASLLYRYMLWTQQGDDIEKFDAVPLFNDILEILVKNPETFSIDGFEEDYSKQERYFLRNVQKSLCLIKHRNNETED